MKKIIASFIALVALVVVNVVGIVSTTSAPAEAGPMCAYGGICGRAWRDADSGYGSSIGVIYTCDWNTKPMRWLYTYQDSANYCADVDGVYARAGEEVWQYNAVGIGYWSKTCGPGPMWCKKTDDWHHRVVLRVAG